MDGAERSGAGAGRALRSARSAGHQHRAALGQGALVGRARAPKAAPPGLAPGSPFIPTARVTLTLLAADVPAQSRPIRAGLFPCMVAVGHEAFTARLQVPPDAEPVPEVAQDLALELLRPELALPKLPAGTEFMLLSGRSLLGRGRVL